MADYASFLALANRLIAKKGFEMAFIRQKTDGLVDPITGKREIIVEKTPFMGVCVKPAEKEIATGHFQGVSQVALAPGDAIANPTISDRLESVFTIQIFYGYIVRRVVAPSYVIYRKSVSHYIARRQREHGSAIRRILHKRKYGTNQARDNALRLAHFTY